MRRVRWRLEQAMWVGLVLIVVVATFLPALDHWFGVVELLKGLF